MFSKLFDCSTADSANRMVDAELAEAGIPGATVNDGGDRYGVGLLQFGGRQAVLFRRTDDYYAVTLAEAPTGDQGRAIDAIDGVNETGFERFHQHGTPAADADVGVRCWAVNHQAGLNQLVVLLHELYGESRLDMTPDGAAFRKLLMLLAELELTEPCNSKVVVMYSDNGKDVHHNRRFTPSGQTVVLKEGGCCYVRPTGDSAQAPWLNAQILCLREGPGGRACVLCNADLRQGAVVPGQQYLAGCQSDTFYVKVLGEGELPDTYLAIARIVSLDSAACEVTFELDAGVEFFTPA